MSNVRSEFRTVYIVLHFSIVENVRVDIDGVFSRKELAESYIKHHGFVNVRIIEKRVNAEAIAKDMTAADVADTYITIAPDSIQEFPPRHEYADVKARPPVKFSGIDAVYEMEFSENHVAQRIIGNGWELICPTDKIGRNIYPSANIATYYCAGCDSEIVRTDKKEVTV